MATKDTLKHLFSHKIKGIIWKIILDDEHQIMAIESRTKEKEVYFYAYDFINKQFLIEDKTFEEKWHLGLSTVHKGILYLHGFENEHSPTQKQILAFDLISNKLLWENYSHTAEGCYEEGIVAFNSRVLPKRLELLNKANGIFIKNISPEELITFRPIINDIKLPEDHFELDLWNSSQTLDYKDLQLKSFYQQKENKIDHVLTVHQNGNLIFTDYLNHDIQKLMQDTFFVWTEKLVYIRNKSEIVSYLL